MYQHLVHSLMVHGVIYAVSVNIYSLSFHICSDLYSVVSTLTAITVENEK